MTEICSRQETQLSLKDHGVTSFRFTMTLQLKIRFLCVVMQQYVTINIFSKITSRESVVHVAQYADTTDRIA